MLRSEIIAAAQELAFALESSGIVDALARRDRSADVATTLNALKKYAIKEASFQPSTRELAGLLDLTPLTDPETWLPIVSGDATVAQAALLRRSVSWATNIVPRFVRLLGRDDEPDPGGLGDSPSRASATFLIVEDRGFLSKPTRVSDLLLAVDQLYQVCSILEEEPGDILLARCDSGSDKSFDFLGAAKVIECLKELVLEIWDRAVYFREHQLNERVKLIGEALPVLERINAGAKSGAIEREQAELLRRTLMDGVAKFVKSGAITPEMDQRAYNNPRQLMAPERKLLGPAQGGDGRNPAAPDAPSGGAAGLTENETAVLNHLLKRAGRSAGGTKRNKESDLDDSAAVDSEHDGP